jgi:hypothetical protein
MFWHSRCIIICDACTTARTFTTAWARCQLVYASGATKAAVNCYFDSYVDTVGICVWPFLLIPRVEDRWENIYSLSPRNTPVNDFRGDSNAANSCDSLRILESCAEPGHLANGSAVHNPHVSITYQLQQRQMTLI